MADGYISQIALPDNTIYDLKDTTKLPLSGGNMTGNINRYYSATSTEPLLKLSANNVDAPLFQMGHGTAAGNVSANYYILKYHGLGSSPQNTLQLISAVSTSTEKVAIEINENGVISFPQMTKGSATKPVYFNAGVFTEGNTYAGGTAVTLNGTSKGANTASFYAPTAVGTSGQVLKSSGSGAPTWENEYKIEIEDWTTNS